MKTASRFAFIVSLLVLHLAVAVHAAPRVDIRTYTQSEAKCFEVKVQEAKIDSPTPAQARINAAIARETRDQIAAFVKRARTDNTDQRTVWDLVVVTRVRLVTDRWLSFTATGGEFTGGAHPIPIVTSSLYDMRSGKACRLADLFTPGTASLDALAKRCRDALYHREDVRSNAGWAEAGFAPRPNNYDVFYLDGKNLVIVFPPYQIAPYSSGTIEVKIPYGALRDIAAPDGPLVRS